MARVSHEGASCYEAGVLTHVVLFRLHDENKSENAARACELLLGMRGKIPELLHIEAGTDVLRTTRSFDLALITRFADRAGLEAYQANPVHQEVLGFLRAVTAQSIAVDYEIPS
jgi:hypothetical protein